MYVANKEHWTALLRVLRYLKKTIDRPLVLKVNSTTTKDLVINVEADSDWAGDRTDRKSQTGVRAGDLEWRGAELLLFQAGNCIFILN